MQQQGRLAPPLLRFPRFCGCRSRSCRSRSGSYASFPKLRRFQVADHDHDMVSSSEDQASAGDAFGDLAAEAEESLGAQEVVTSVLDDEDGNVEADLHRVKDILDVARNGEPVARRGARMHDFCLGIPYGGALVATGVVLFILTGSASAIQVGLLLGGLLLALSISSFKAWKRGQSSMSYIQGQAAIAFLIFSAELQKHCQVGSFPGLLSVFVSGSMVVFYCYVFLAGGNPPPKKIKPVPGRFA